MSRLPTLLATCCAVIVLALAGCVGGSAEPEALAGAGELPAPAASGDGAAGLGRMADTALRTGDPATAASLFEQALVRDGGNLPAAVGLGTALLSLARPQDAGRAFERALAIDGNAPSAHYGYARAMMALRRPELAVPHLEAIVDRRPNDVQALNALGVAHDLLGRQDRAVIAYRRGLAVAPANVALRNNLGLSLAISGRFTDAVDQLRPLGEGPEASRRTRQNLALVYGLAGDLAAAQRVGRSDLSESELQANLAYVAAVRGLRNPSLRAAAVAPVSPVPGERRVTAASAGGEAPAPSVDPSALGGAEERRLAEMMPMAGTQPTTAPRRRTPAGPAMSPFFD